MDLAQAEAFIERLSHIVDHPPADTSRRAQLSTILSVSALQFAASTRLQCSHELLLGACATLRSQFEALVRSVWVLHRATDAQVEKLLADLNIETQQASKNMPSTNEMLAELDKAAHLANLLISLHEFKSSSWLPLNSFVHSGIHAVHWTKHGTPLPLLDQAFRTSNGLALLSFQGLGILTGIPDIQKRLISESVKFYDILPPQRIG